MRAEPDYAFQAAQVLERQRRRVLDAARALLQHIEFLRPCDLRPEEREALAFCRAFLAERKPVESERGSVERKRA
jgi:hypothetical protein